MTADEIARENARDIQTARRIELIQKVRQKRAQTLLDLTKSIAGVPWMLTLFLVLLLITIWRLS